MCSARHAAAAFALVLAPLVLTSCAGRNRVIARGTHPATQTLLTATKAELVKRIADFYESIQSFDATVDLTPSLGSVYKGKIMDYQDVTAYIDFRKPADIRVVGLLPVVRSTAFSMVSDGKEFKVYLPLKNRFIEGANAAAANSQNKFENIRPETFLAAMLVKPVAPDELTLMVDDTTEQYAFYQLAIIRKMPNGDIEASRRVTFDRVNLQIVEQREYGPDASIVSLTKYNLPQIYSGVRFPSHIEITRPKDEYGIVLDLTKMEINKPVPDSKFTLARPEGTELQVIGLDAPKAPK